MTTPATIPASRPADVWSLLSFAYSAFYAHHILVTSHSITGEDVTVAYESRPMLGLGRWAVRLDEENRVRRERDPFVLDLDHTERPEDATRHLVHDDERGITLRTPAGEPLLTFRLGADDRVQTTPHEVYAWHRHTFDTITTGLTERGLTGVHVDYLSDNDFVVVIPDPADPDHVYGVVPSWHARGVTPLGWYIVESRRIDDLNQFGDPYRVVPAIDLHLPLDTPVEMIVRFAADRLLTELAA